jgi:hypothetical protein
MVIAYMVARQRNSDTDRLIHYKNCLSSRSNKIRDKRKEEENLKDFIL